MGGALPRPCVPEHRDCSRRARRSRSSFLTRPRRCRTTNNPLPPGVFFFFLFPAVFRLPCDLGVRWAGSGGVGGLLAAQGQLRQRHGLMREALRGQHGEGVTWGATGSKHGSKRGTGDQRERTRRRTHCRCSRAGPPCEPAPGCQRGSNAARRAGRRVSWPGGGPGGPRYAGACAFYVLLCSFETKPIKTQRNKTSWSSAPQRTSKDT